MCRSPALHHEATFFWRSWGKSSNVCLRAGIQMRPRPMLAFPNPDTHPIQTSALISKVINQSIMQLSEGEDSWLPVALLPSCWLTFHVRSPALWRLAKYSSLSFSVSLSCPVQAVEAIHLGSLIAAQGYIFPISDHVLTMKDDGTFYRFQVGLPAPCSEELSLIIWSQFRRTCKTKII